MALPEIGRPLPRAADAFVDDEKWLGYVLSERGHRGHWSRAFGTIDPDALWAMIAQAVLDADVTEMRTVESGGISCRVPITITINDRTRAVRTVWHYAHADAAPRLVTAFPTT
jgi:hypothetical protein